MVSWTDLPAYWINPPSWPRKLFCENRLCQTKYLRNPWLMIIFVVLFYFTIMDYIVFGIFNETDLSSPSPPVRGEWYKPWTHLWVRGLLKDHIGQYIIAPTTEYFDMVTHFSDTFTFVSPNMISIFHGVVGFTSGKFLSSSDLLDRRLGVLLFEWRSWLDAFAGTVNRAQAGHRLNYTSDHSTTLGYVTNFTADILGIFFLSFGILFYLIKKYRPLQTQHGADGKDQKPLLPTSSVQVAPPSVKLLVLQVVGYGVCLGVAWRCWDQSVEDFSTLFQTPIQDKSLKAIQTEYCHSLLTLSIFYLWRFLGGPSILAYTLLAVFSDTIEEYIKLCHYLLLPATVLLYLATGRYIYHIREDLHL